MAKKKEGYKALATAILEQSIKDHKTKTFKEETKVFFDGVLFINLCDYLDVDSKKIRRVVS